MAKFCFICGGEEKKEGLCEKCFLERNALAVIPEKTEVTVCSKCGFSKAGIQWREFEIKKYIKRILKAKGKIDDMEIKITKRARSDIDYKIILSGSVGNIKKTEEHLLAVHLNKIVCPTCAKILSGYYEAVIQLRGAPESAISYAAGEFKKEKDNPNSFFRMEEKKEGVDIFAGSKCLAQTIVSRINRKFNVHISTSFKLAGMKNGRTLTRGFFLVRFNRTFESTEF